jgi:hypothetical protein
VQAPCPARPSASGRLDEVVDAQICIVNAPPVRRRIGVRPVTPLVYILPGLTGMLNDLVGDADWIAKGYAGIITLAHG